MDEAPNSDLRLFSTDDFDELFIGVGEMTGLDDRDVNYLLEGIPNKRGPIKVRNVCALDPEKAKIYSVFLELSYPDGETFSVGMTKQNGTFFTVNKAGSWVTGAINEGMIFVPPKPAESASEPDTSAVDESWDVW
jgi:hypothetical protein